MRVCCEAENAPLDEHRRCWLLICCEKYFNLNAGAVGFECAGTCVFSGLAGFQPRLAYALNVARWGGASKSKPRARDEEVLMKPCKQATCIACKCVEELSMSHSRTPMFIYFQYATTSASHASAGRSPFTTFTSTQLQPPLSFAWQDECCSPSGGGCGPGRGPWLVCRDAGAVSQRSIWWQLDGRYVKRGGRKGGREGGRAGWKGMEGCV